jgi:thiamine-monophosphate kinase
LGSEAEIIERIWKRLPICPTRRGWLSLGPGDDAAVIGGGPRAANWVLSSDAFIQDIHFVSEVFAPEDVGYKALARATSDLAAMGAVPTFFLMNLVLPDGKTGRWLDGMLTGMARAAREFGMVIIGGDVAKAGAIAIHLTVGGSALHGRVLERSGARPEDGIYVSGRLGEAQLGLELVLRRLHKTAAWRRLVAPYLRPKIQTVLGRWLASEGSRQARRPGSAIASAAIDTSDGLSSDLSHICEASGVGARIWADRIPAVRVPDGLLRKGFNPLELALHGGEDYQLVFTVRRAMEWSFPKSRGGVALTRIGEVVDVRNFARRHTKARIELIDAVGRGWPLVAKGWDHFRAADGR